MPFIKKVPFKTEDRCTHPEHNPPNMIVLQPGMYTWKCPACGKEQTFTVPLISLGDAPKPRKAPWPQDAEVTWKNEYNMSAR